MGSDSLKEVARIMKQCKVPVLYMARCDLRPGDLKMFLQTIGTTKVKILYNILI